jgi:hypothetical protein
MSRRQSGWTAGARWGRPRTEKLGEETTEDREAIAGRIAPSDTSLLEAEALMEAAVWEEAAGLSVAAGPTGAAAAARGDCAGLA